MAPSLNVRPMCLTCSMSFAQPGPDVRANPPSWHRFVPDETSFEGDPVHDEATESTIAAAGPDYQGLEFVTDVLSSPWITRHDSSLTRLRLSRLCDIPR